MRHHLQFVGSRAIYLADNKLYVLVLLSPVPCLSIMVSFKDQSYDLHFLAYILMTYLPFRNTVISSAMLMIQNYSYLSP